MYPAYYTYTPTRLRKAERNFLKQGKKHKNKKKKEPKTSTLLSGGAGIVDCPLHHQMRLGFILEASPYNQPYSVAYFYFGVFDTPCAPAPLN